MQYHHIYHAGNFADVFKHCVLIMLVQTLCKKDKPFVFLDTHAGIGRYDVTSAMAQKTGEYQAGISVVYGFPDLVNAPDVIKTYVDLVRAQNHQDAKKIAESENTLHCYPGSPAIVQALLRPQDRMILVELHQEDVKLLKQEFAQDKRIAVHHANGYQSMKAFLPPKQGRGLILMDPAFEDPNDFNNIIAALKDGLERFPHGIYAVWYPIKDNLPIRDFQQELSFLGFQNVLLTEFSIGKVATADTHLKRCGMAIINPPWQFAEQLEPVITWLEAVLC